MFNSRTLVGGEGCLMVVCSCSLAILTCQTRTPGGFSGHAQIGGQQGFGGGSGWGPFKGMLISQRALGFMYLVPAQDSDAMVSAFPSELGLGFKLLA